MFEYGKTFLEENNETLKRLKEFMTPEGFEAALIMSPNLDDEEDSEDEEIQAA